jgi:hypothetical protein
MKLMKKNSSLSQGNQQNNKKPNAMTKFDWTKITDRNSSVHSEELNYNTKAVEGNIDEILSLKKRVK